MLLLLSILFSFIISISSVSMKLDFYFTLSLRGLLLITLAIHLGKRK